MKVEIFYYLISLTLFFLAIYLSINQVYIRVKRKTILGLAYRPGTSEYKRLNRMVNNSSIAIVGFLIALLGLNLGYDIYRILGWEDSGYARGLLIVGALFVVVLFALILPAVNKQAKALSDLNKKSKHE